MSAAVEIEVAAFSAREGAERGSAPLRLWRYSIGSARLTVLNGCVLHRHLPPCSNAVMKTLAEQTHRDCSYDLVAVRDGEATAPQRLVA